MTDSKTTSYIFAINMTLFNEWGWFENRGYLPPMPGSLEEPECFNHRTNRWEAHLLVSEPEAWEFQEAWNALGMDAGACLHLEGLEDIRLFLDQIV
jgi:hypothetical protein